MFLKQESVNLDKETPYRVTAPVIPIYSPACLGNAYGGGYIIMPTVFVTNPEAKDIGNSTLGYSFSYSRNSSGSAHPNTTTAITGTSSPSPTTSTVTLKKAQPDGSDLTSALTAQASLRSTLVSHPPISSALQATFPYRIATSPSRSNITSTGGDGRISTLHTFASSTSSSYEGVLPSKDLLDKDVPGKALPNKDPSRKIVPSQNPPSQDLPKDLTSKVFYSKELLTNDPSSMIYLSKDVLSKDQPGENMGSGKFTDPVYGQGIGSTKSASSKSVQSSSHSTTRTEFYPETSVFSSPLSAALNPLTVAGQNAKTFDGGPKLYQEAVTFEFPALDIRESLSPTPPQLQGEALNVSTVPKGDPSSAVTFLGSRGLVAKILATMFGVVAHGLFA